jgi:hypothetical protein
LCPQRRNVASKLRDLRLGLLVLCGGDGVLRTPVRIVAKKLRRYLSGVQKAKDVIKECIDVSRQFFSAPRDVLVRPNQNQRRVVEGCHSGVVSLARL